MDEALLMESLHDQIAGRGDITASMIWMPCLSRPAMHDADHAAFCHEQSTKSLQKLFGFNGLVGLPFRSRTAHRLRGVSPMTSLNGFCTTLEMVLRVPGDIYNTQRRRIVCWLLLIILSFDSPLEDYFSRAWLLGFVLVSETAKAVWLILLANSFHPSKQKPTLSWVSTREKEQWLDAACQSLQVNSGRKFRADCCAAFSRTCNCRALQDESLLGMMSALVFL